MRTENNCLLYHKVYQLIKSLIASLPNLGRCSILLQYLQYSLAFSEAAIRDVLWTKMFLEISQNSLENTCVRGLDLQLY